MKTKTGNPLFHKLLLESTLVGIDQLTVRQVRFERGRNRFYRKDD